MNNEKETKEVKKELDVIRLRNRIFQLDEILVMSTQMAVASSDLQWEKRYLKSVPLLNKAIDEAKKLYSDSFLKLQIIQIDQAIQKLIVIEKEAFTKMKAGEKEAAQKLLLSDEYLHQKAIYSKSMANFSRAKDPLVRLEELRGLIIYLDEVLTMSASLAVVSGNVKWKQRYFDFELQLVDVLEEADALQSSLGQSTYESTDKTDKANKLLIEMEKDAFEKVDKGELVSAQEIIFGSKYLEQKAIYTQGMQALSKNISSTLKTLLQQKEQKILSQTLLLVLVLLSLIVCWIYLAYTLGRWNQTVKREVAYRTQEIQKTTEDLVLAKNQAEDANRVKTDFLANMSHEIRTPMNGVVGASDLLIETNLDMDQKEYVQLIKNSALGLLDIINDILDFSKISAGKLTFANSPFDMKAVVLGTCELMHNCFISKCTYLLVLLEFESCLCWILFKIKHLQFHVHLDMFPSICRDNFSSHQSLHFLFLK